MTCSDDDCLSQLTQGDTWNFDIEATADGVVPENLAGAVMWCTVKALLSDPDSAALLQFSATVADDANSEAGLYRLSVPASLTKLVPPSDAVWIDIRRVFSGPPEDVWSVLPAQQIAIMPGVGTSFI